MTDPLIDHENEDVDADPAQGVDLPESGGNAEVDPAADGPADDTVEAVSSEDTRASAGGETEAVVPREEFDSLNDRHLRLVAEFNNFRRRSEQERLSAWSRAQADLIGKFLDLVDDLQRVAELDLSNATVEAIMEGIDLVERKFVRVLEDAGVEMIDPTGEKFDPEQMEAMMRVPAESDEHVDTVAQVFQKGYALKGILVRPARVSVFTQG